MRSPFKARMGSAIAVGVVVAAAGCYEDLSGKQGQTAPAPPPQPAAMAKPGPVTGTASQGGGSALGGAKRAAGNVVQQAEEQSKKVAKDAEPE